MKPSHVSNGPDILVSLIVMAIYQSNIFDSLIWPDCHSLNIFPLSLSFVIPICDRSCPLAICTISDIRCPVSHYCLVWPAKCLSILLIPPLAPCLLTRCINVVSVSLLNIPPKFSSALLAHNYLALAIFVYLPFFLADINKRFIYLWEVTMKFYLHRRINACSLPHDAITKI